MPIEYDRAAKSAARANKRAAERHPLFAAMGALDEVYAPRTAEDVISEIDRMDLKLERGDILSWLNVRIYTLQLEALVGAEQMEVWRSYFCRVFPVSWQSAPEHIANFWHGKLKAVLGIQDTGPSLLINGRPLKD